ncbi:MAG: DUF427 domain-containing protein [Ilumatobacteraceae bacterium]
MSQEPDSALRRARQQWTHRGSARPSFAITPAPGQESVWDYPRPPAVVPDARRVRIGPIDDPIADSTGAVRVLETASPPTVYLPPNDVRTDLLVPTAGSSTCEWKGRARYWALAALFRGPGGVELHEPFPEFVAITGYLALPGSHRVLDRRRASPPQPSEFYGGWVTDEIVGPFKGEPGTGHW